MSPRRKKQKLELHRDPIFGFYFMMVVGGKESDAMRKFCRRFNLRPPDIVLDTNLGSFAENADSPYCGLIWVEEDASASTIAHECAHATAHVCRVLQLDPRQADEFQASYTGWLVRNMTRLYYRRGK